MAKKKTSGSFFCKECGAESARWFGRCPACEAWNSLVDAPAAAPTRSHGAAARGRGRARAGFAGGVRSEPPRPLGDGSRTSGRRTGVGMPEFDRTLGGGLVPGSVILLGGDPGVGKSTLALQAAGRLAAGGDPVLYVTGEESREQVQMRADRLGGTGREMLLATEADVDRIGDWVAEHRPAFVVVDSIQTVHSPEIDGAPGSVLQVRESGFRLHTIAKSSGAAILLIGHVTKDGSIAGPRVLEHMVDTVLYLEGERIGGYRVLRAVKNRFGSTDEIGLFEMRETGMHEVTDPSRVLVDLESGRADGSIVVPTIEGTRPLLLEVQALVTPTSYGMAQRVATGVDPKRLAVLLAVLRKHAGVDVSDHDVFLNVVSGIRITEPASDLGVLLAVVSSLRDRALPERMAAVGEVGLGGEVRGVAQLDRRVAEAVRVGFTEVLVPAVTGRDLPARLRTHARLVRNVSEAMTEALAARAPRASARVPAVAPAESSPDDRMEPAALPDDEFIDPGVDDLLDGDDIPPRRPEDPFGPSPTA